MTIRRLLKKAIGRGDATCQPFVSTILNDNRFVALDVGASHGLLPHWVKLLDFADIYAIEPDPEASRVLRRHYRNANYKVLEGALSGTGGPRTLYVTNAPTGASLLKPDPKKSPIKDYMVSDYFYPIKEKIIQTTTLKQFLDEIGELSVDLMKLDIQGAELEVMTGLDQERMHSTLGIELEVGMPGLYMNQPQFSEVHSYLEKYGFNLFDVRVARCYLPLHGKDNGYQREVFCVYDNSPSIAAKVVELDVIYFKDANTLIKNKDGDSIRKLIVIYCIYNYFCEALDLSVKANAAGIISNADLERTREAIIRWHKRLNYRFYYSPKSIFKKLRRFLYFISPKSAPRWCQHMYQEYPNG